MRPPDTVPPCSAQTGNTESAGDFAPEVATGLFGHLVGAISGTSVYRKSTFLLDSLGKQILPDWLTIRELPHVIGGLASTPFDSEGSAQRIA